MRSGILICTLLAIILFSCDNSTTDSNTSKNSPSETAPATPVLANKGQLLFQQKCSACHGSGGAAGIGGAANLHTSTLDSSAITYIIDNGKNAMPSFKGQLTQDEMKDITAYLMDLRK